MSQNAAKPPIRAPTQQPLQHQTIGSPTTALLRKPLLVKLSPVKCFILLRNRLMIITVRKVGTGSPSGPSIRTITNVILSDETLLTTVLVLRGTISHLPENTAPNEAPNWFLFTAWRKTHGLYHDWWETFGLE